MEISLGLNVHLLLLNYRGAHFLTATSKYATVRIVTKLV